MVETEEVPKAPTPSAYLDAFDPSSIRYVSHVGNDANDGKTQATAWRSIATAAQRALAGQVIFVRAGIYANESISFSRSGTAGQPIRLIGYTTTPGDAPTVGSGAAPRTPDATLLPLIDGGNRAFGTAINLSSRQRIQIENLQIQNYEIGVYADDTTHSTLRNLYIARLGDVQHSYKGVGLKLATGSNFNVVNAVTIHNAAAEGLSVAGDDNVVSDSRVFADDNSTGVNSATDYFIITSGNRNQFLRNVVQRFGDLDHVGHGIGSKGNSSGNLFVDNKALNFEGAAYYVRHRGSRLNVFRNNLAENGSGYGFVARDGASDNVIETHTIRNLAYGVGFLDTSEDGGLQSSGDHNSFTGLIANNIASSVISMGSYEYTETTGTGNVFASMQVDGAGRLFEVAHRAIDMLIRDSVIRNVGTYALYRPGRTTADLDVVITGTVGSSNGFALP